MNTAKGFDTSKEKLDIKKQLHKMISATGPDIFNPDKISSTNGPGNETTIAPFDQILEFMTAVMTKEYAEAVRIGELVLNIEAENKTVREFLPVLKKLMTIPSHGDGCSDSSSESNSDGSSSESGDGDEDSLSSDEGESSKEKANSGSGSDTESGTSSESDSENSDSDSDSSETGSFSSGSDEVDENVSLSPTDYDIKAWNGDPLT